MPSADQLLITEAILIIMAPQYVVGTSDAMKIVITTSNYNQIDMYVVRGM